jgi:hypothetical protein
MAYNDSELQRILSALKETKLTLTFKLNLLRSAAASSPTHLAIFDNLVDRLVDSGSKMWILEEGVKEREASLYFEDDDDVRSSLKKAMELVGTMDALGEEIMRLKIALEGVQVGSELSGRDTVKTIMAESSRGHGSQPVVASAQIILDQGRLSKVRLSFF